PTYNGERFVAQALASVAAQQGDGVEIIAVDDGSTDRTLDILRRWSRALALTIIERPHSGNWVESTAIGTAQARGTYICWLHQDDAWSSRRLTVLRAVLENRPEAAFLVHPCWYSNVQGQRIGYWRCPLPRVRRLLRFDEVARPLLVQCSIGTCGTLFSAEAARQVGAPDATLAYHADWDYWLRLARLGRTLYHPTPLASFRIHAGSQTIARAGEADARLGEARTVLRRHLPHFAACGGDARRVEAVASVSAQLNHALNALVAAQEFDAARLLRAAAKLGPAGWAKLLGDSQIVERCLSRLQASAGLRPLVIEGLRRSMARLAGRQAADGKPGLFTGRAADGAHCPT
ncbi:MAG: glycosyltransferase, partial [Pirellulales bacterium]